MVTTVLELHSSNCQGSIICIPGVSIQPTQSLAEYACSSLQHFGGFTISKKIITPSPYFEPGVYVFVLVAPYKFTPLLNLLSFIFGLKPVGWLRYIAQNPYL
jgi:hypothetical protein